MADAYHDDQPTPETKDKGGKKGRLSDDELKTMRKRYQHGVERDQENRIHAREDLAFRSGDAQWDDTERRAREAAQRPTLSFNKSGAFIRQVTGDVRQNKPAIKVSPSGDGARKETAEIYAGLIRNIEQQSHAPYVYSQAADNSVTCGFGYWRIVTEYARDDSFEQDIRIKPIPNPLSVVRDPDAQELDRSDAKWWFIYSSMSTDDFEEQYPEARKIEWEKLDKDDRATYEGWYSKDTVRIAEYWCKKPALKTLLLLSDGRVLCKDDYDGVALKEQMGKATVEQERTVKTHKITQHMVSGAEELEEPREWIGSYIPIIEVIGEEIWVDEKCVKAGLIRQSKDAMRAYNYARSTSIEVTSLQPKAPWVLSTTMIEGYEKIWDQANTNLPYLPYNSDPNVPGGPKRVEPPVPAPGLMAEAEMANRDIQATIGIYDPQLGAKSNETSGKAIIAREQQGDTGTFVWIDNLGLAIAYTGRILIDLMPKIYDTRRVLRVLGDDGEEKQVVVNHVTQGLDGQERVAHDPTKGFYDITAGKYDITVQPGPSFASKREQASTGILEMMKILGPAAAPLLGARLARLQDWPHSEDVSEDLEKLLPPQLQKPKMGPDGQPMPMPEPPPPPEAMKAKAEMMAMADRQKFDEAKARADMELKREMQQAQAQLDQAEAERKFALAQWTAQQTAALNRWIAEQELMTQRMRAGAEIDLKAGKQQHEMRMKGMDQAHQMDMREGEQEHAHMMAERMADGEGE